jgi:hypothetical protein
MAACTPRLLPPTGRGIEKRVTPLSYLDIPTQPGSIRGKRIDALWPSGDVVVLFKTPVNLVRPSGRGLRAGA